MLVTSGGYLGSEKPPSYLSTDKGYLPVDKGGYGGVYSSNYNCYYTNMDYLAPTMSHSVSKLDLF